jgi:hypothetical protein
MASNEDIFRLIEAFYNNRIGDISLYIEGFGGFFLSRTKDGIVIGYVDKNKHFGTDDHFTVLLDNQKVKGIHRKVSDNETDVYVRYEVDYLSSPSGIGKLMQDMQRQANVSLSMKLLFVILYKGLNWSFEGKHHKSIKTLEDSRARELGMKPPCIYVKLRFPEKVVFASIGKVLSLTGFLYKRKFKERPTDGFREQRFPGSHITKHPKKKKS